MSSIAIDDKSEHRDHADPLTESNAGTAPFNGKPRRNVSVSLSTFIAAVVAIGLVAATLVSAGLYWTAKSELAERDARAADEQHAEQVAMDYAIGASAIDYRELQTWFDNLKENTAPNLAAKFDATATQLEQILLPLQWTSSATPISAVATSVSDGIYKVNAFLNVNTTSAQTPQGGLATVTYSLTLDKNADWMITDVGGLETALPSN